MKIAIPTDDRTHISEHTGRATFFAIASIENGNMTHLDFRVNPPHQHTHEGEHDHAETVNLLSDCETILVRNIGKNLKSELLARHIKIEFTNSQSIGEGIKRYLSNFV